MSDRTAATAKSVEVSSGLAVDDAAFLEGLAGRLSQALYYDKVDAIGYDGNVSSGLRHDDYDRLRAMAKAIRIAALKAELAVLEESVR